MKDRRRKDSSYRGPERRKAPRRSADREPVTLPVTLLRAGEVMAHNAPSTDLSVTGVFVKCAAQLLPRTQVELRLLLDGTEVFATGEVVAQRSSPGGTGGFGIRFRRLSSADRQRIESFIGRRRAGRGSTGVL